MLVYEDKKDILASIRRKEKTVLLVYEDKTDSSDETALVMRMSRDTPDSRVSPAKSPSRRSSPSTAVTVRFRLFSSSEFDQADEPVMPEDVVVTFTENTPAIRGSGLRYYGLVEI